MTASDIAVVITAIAAVFASLGSLSVAAVTLLQVVKTHRMADKQRTEIVEMLEQQNVALETAGITPPDDDGPR